MTDDTSKELPRAETLLRELALREPDWDSFATRVENNLAAAPSSDEALFEAPLLTADADEGAPAELGAAPNAPAELVSSAGSEPPPSISAREATAAELEEATEIEPEPSEPAAAPAAGVSLADLARASVAKRGSGEARSIAKESMAVLSQSRAQGEKLAARPVAASVARSERPAAGTPQAPSGQRGLFIAIGAVALAAGYGLYVAGQRSVPTQTVVIAEPESATPEAPVAKLDPGASRAAAETKPEQTPRGHDIDSLPLAPSPPVEQKPLAQAGGRAPTARAPAATGPAPSPAVAAEKVAAEKVELEEEGPAAPKVEPPKTKPEAALRPADDTSAGSSERPSTGAAQAAVGAVLGAARSCVAGHASPATAQVTFGSDGTVNSVSVGGAAAGTPAASCIEAALKKARVQPFAASSFSLGVTVRPP